MEIRSILKASNFTVSITWNTDFFSQSTQNKLIVQTDIRHTDGCRNRGRSEGQGSCSCRDCGCNGHEAARLPHRAMLRTLWEMMFWYLPCSSHHGNYAKIVSIVLKGPSKATPVSSLQFTTNFSWAWISGVMVNCSFFLYQSSFLVPSNREGSHREGISSNFCKGARHRQAQIKQLSLETMRGWQGRIKEQSRKHNRHLWVC